MYISRCSKCLRIHNFGFYNETMFCQKKILQQPKNYYYTAYTMYPQYSIPIFSFYFFFTNPKIFIMIIIANLNLLLITIVLYQYFYFSLNKLLRLYYIYIYIIIFPLNLIIIKSTCFILLILFC